MLRNEQQQRPRGMTHSVPISALSWSSWGSMAALDMAVPGDKHIARYAGRHTFQLRSRGR